MRLTALMCWLAAAAQCFAAGGNAVTAAGGAVRNAPRQPAAVAGENAERTFSPYFHVNNGDPTLDRLPLKSTAATATIAGVIAAIHVTQVYRNEGQRPIEAVYVFPASTRVAVHGMTMTIGARVLRAELRERDEARRAYEQARDDGQRASLLEEHRPNVFQMSVANILPGDEIKTDLHYTEWLGAEDGIYEWVYPTVVGPRYAAQGGDSAPAAETWVGNPYLHEGDADATALAVTVRLETGTPVREVLCPTHQVKIVYESQTIATVGLAATEKYAGNRDFVLRYRLAGERMTSGLVLHEGSAENFFLLTLEPPRRVTARDIPPREYIFIVDVSGSMHGFPLDISKELLRKLLGSLRPSDTFNVLLFSGGSRLLADRSLPATMEHVRTAVAMIERERGGGGTELLPALRRALALPRSAAGARTVVIVTDGFVAVEKEAFDLIRSQLGQANCFTFGIGSSVNRHLIEGMARAGAGEPFVVLKPDEAPRAAERFEKMIEAPLLTRIQLDFGGFQAYDVEPAGVPDLFAQRPLVVFGKWRGRPQGTIRFRGVSADGPHEERLDVSRVRPRTDNGALRQLWARSRLAALQDDQRIAQRESAAGDIRQLALQYGLLSDHTSFVAIDLQPAREGGEWTTVVQPLPLPAGVSDYAVGGAMARAAMKVLGPRQAASAAAVGHHPEPAGPAAEGKEQAISQLGEADVAARGTNELQFTVTAARARRAVDLAAVSRALDARRAQIDACCRASVTAASAWEADVELIIDTHGQLSAVQLITSPADGQRLAECLRAQLKDVAFVDFPGGGTVTLRIACGGNSGGA
jgi:Ca-activated chloride channel family protein